MKKKINLHLFALLIFSIYYLFSLLIFNNVVINPHDNLEISAVYNHIISKIYKGDFNSYKIFLSGEFKWYYLDTILYPKNILHFFTGDKQFYFLEEILKKIISYFSFYLLGKSLIKNKFYIILGAVLYTSLVNDHNSPPPTYFLPTMPYILYLLVSKTEFKLRHVLAISFIGLNSSIVFDYPSLIVMILFAAILTKLKNKKNLLIFFCTITLSMIASNLPIILSIIGEPLHRVAIEKENLTNILRSEFLNIYNIFLPNNLYNIFFWGSNLLKVFLLIMCCFIKNKNLRLLTFFIICTYLFKILFSSEISQILFKNVLEFLQGYNFSRIENILPLLFSIILVVILNLSEKKVINQILIFLTIFSTISHQIYLPSKEFAKEFLKNNLESINLELVKKEYNNNNLKNILSIVKDKNNFNSKNFDFNFKTNNSFDTYFKKETYKKIRAIVKKDRVASIGTDPMIAAMNNINVIDGYHTLYQLSYKKRFRKIIETELDQTKKLKEYFDNWGNRAYLFYNDPNNLLINFKEVKNLGAKYIISSFSIKNEALESDHVLYDEKNKIYLYRLI